MTSHSETVGVRPNGALVRVRTLASCVTPTGRVVALSGAMALFAAVLYGLGIHDVQWTSGAVHVPWPLLAALFALTDCFVVHVEIRDNAHSFTLNELPLVLALFFSTPTGLVLARVVAAVAVLAFVKRQALVKVFFNVVLAVLGAEVALLFFTALRGRSA